jgi:hypothetical protein
MLTGFPSNYFRIKHGLIVLQSVQLEIETRGQLFKDIGVSELKDYRQKTNKQIPRVLVVIDEFQYMFQDNDAITRDLNQLYEDITRRGRSVSISFLLSNPSTSTTSITAFTALFHRLRVQLENIFWMQNNLRIIRSAKFDRTKPIVECPPRTRIHTHPILNGVL